MPSLWAGSLLAVCVCGAREVGDEEKGVNKDRKSEAVSPL